MEVALIIVGFLCLTGLIMAITTYFQRKKPPELVMSAVKIDKEAQQVYLGGVDRIAWNDILSLQQISQFNTTWNEYGIDNQKYKLVYQKGEEKRVINLVVYDNDTISLDRKDELNAIVVNLRYNRIQAMKKIKGNA